MRKLKNRKSEGTKYYSFYQRSYQGESLFVSGHAGDVVCIEAHNASEANTIADDMGLLDLTEEGGFERFVACKEKDGEVYPHYYGNSIEDMRVAEGDSNSAKCIVRDLDGSFRTYTLWSLQC